MRAIEVVTLTKVEGANLNSNGTEGVIAVLKKVRDPVDGREYVRVSGQSVKYHLRQLLKELGWELSQVVPKSERGQKVIVSLGEPHKYIDDDLFGYMIAKKVDGKNATLRRTAVVRTNGMISLFPYQEDRDFGVRYDPSGDNHNIYETEITTNVMRGNFFIELDRLGVFKEGLEVPKLDGLEAIKEKDVTGREVTFYVLPKEERERRLRAILEAIMNYHGGAKLSNFFTKVYPEVMVVALLRRKIPVIGDALSVKPGYVDGKLILDIDRLKETVETFKDNIEKLYIGLFESRFANVEELREAFKDMENVEVLSMKELRKRLKELKLGE
ncbi:type I-B CRISPR-associated protein Cas7/Cst2/DevR [Pyrococcus yayanosii]|uniref:CRISPR-associated autoregulator DevR family protein protein n=1 Tax=Pyrococcus yayanosii (strain CH1 / JCM 16557) TaxID=529709 RepID=F8AGC5_PYRYC|nr:type I-B CRISPR-associated protein Cas7/Cst2/DevR [Pyrococcus yayanosii]AEH25121.1 CRISPR-associated autoregulator DevR family protein protein [Pyrococcus yayanosii CH1]